MNARIRRNLTAPAAAAVSTLIVLAWLAAGAVRLRRIRAFMASPCLR